MGTSIEYPKSVKSTTALIVSTLEKVPVKSEFIFFLGKFFFVCTITTNGHRVRWYDNNEPLRHSSTNFPEGTLVYHMYISVGDRVRSPSIEYYAPSALGEKRVGFIDCGLHWGSIIFLVVCMCQVPGTAYVLSPWYAFATTMRRSFMTSA